MDIQPHDDIPRNRTRCDNGLLEGVKKVNPDMGMGSGVHTQDVRCYFHRVRLELLDTESDSMQFEIRAKSGIITIRDLMRTESLLTLAASPNLLPHTLLY